MEENNDSESGNITIKEMLTKHVNIDWFLPSIQREFVWKMGEKRIQRLFDSIIQNYPVGNFIFWEIRPYDTEWDLYKFIEEYNDSEKNSESIHHKSGDDKVKLILDGQQRIIALYIGLKGDFIHRGKKHNLFIDLLSDLTDDEDNPYDLKYNLRFFEETPHEDGKLWIKFKKIINYKDLNELESDLKNKLSLINDLDTIKKEKALELWKDIYEKICVRKDIIRLIPVKFGIDEDDKVLNVFIRTNSAGVSLEKSDLLLSVLESKSREEDIFSRNAREEIKKFVNDLETENDIEFKKDEILKTCLFFSGVELKYNLKNFKNRENIKKISNSWEDVKYYLKLTAKLIRSYKLSGKHISSKNSIIPLAYYLKKRGKKDSFINSNYKEDVNLRNNIIRALIISNLNGIYSSSSDTALKNVRDNINRFYKKNLIKSVNFKIVKKENIEKWFEKEYYNSKNSLLLLFLTMDKNLWGENIKIHQDHIFNKDDFKPKKLRKNLSKISNGKIRDYNLNKNKLMNLQILPASLNEQKQKKSMKDLLKLMRSNKKYREEFCYPSRKYLDWNKFLEFCEKRKKIMIKKVMKELGVK